MKILPAIYKTLLAHQCYQNFVKSALYWAEDINRDLLDNKPYPISYLTGELDELKQGILDGFSKGKWNSAAKELGDTLYAAQMIAAQRLGLNLPILFADDQIKKFYSRLDVWKKIFEHAGAPFSVKYLSGGSNYAKPEKIQKALHLADKNITPQQIAKIGEKFNIQFEYPPEKLNSKN